MYLHKLYTRDVVCHADYNKLSQIGKGFQDFLVKDAFIIMIILHDFNAVHSQLAHGVTQIDEVTLTSQTMTSYSTESLL